MGGWDDRERRWGQEAQTILTGLTEWRRQHPRATFRDLEVAVEAQLSRLRARLLEDLALASRAADVQGQPAGDRPRCPTCDVPLAPQGQHTRTVVVQGGQAVPLRRDYATCPACGSGLFPPG